VVGLEKSAPHRATDGARGRPFAHSHDGAGEPRWGGAALNTVASPAPGARAAPTDGHAPAARRSSDPALSGWWQRSRYSQFAGRGTPTPASGAARPPITLAGLLVGRVGVACFLGSHRNAGRGTHLFDREKVARISYFHRCFDAAAVG
jgi:hypothetical protein